MHERMLNRQESNSSPQSHSKGPRSESVRHNANRNSFTEYDEQNKGPDVKKEEELECLRKQLLDKIGTLGSSVKIELLSKPGQLIDLTKVMNFEVQRKPLNNNTYEWFGFDQVLFYKVIFQIILFRIV